MTSLTNTKRVSALLAFVTGAVLSISSCTKKPVEKAEKDSKPSREFTIIDKSTESMEKANEHVRQVEEAMKNNSEPSE